MEEEVVGRVNGTMTATVKFFRLIREAVAEEQTTIPLSDELRTVAQLKTHLGQRGEQWREALSHPNLIQAVNQRVVFEDQLLKNTDEVAFFPPMTGG